MTASFASVVPIPPSGMDNRDRLLARLLLCVHPAIPRDCQGPAALVWALDADPAVAARAIRRSAPKVEWLLVRFERRVAALRLPERIPIGRNCSDRMASLIDWVAVSAARLHFGGTHGPDSPEAELLMTLGGLAEFLVCHPLAGTLGAHRLRSDLAHRRRQLHIEVSLEEWLAAGRSRTARTLSAVIPSTRLI